MKPRRLVGRKLRAAEIARRLSRPGEAVTLNAVGWRLRALGLALPRGRPRKAKRRAMIPEAITGGEPRATSGEPRAASKHPGQMTQEEFVAANRDNFVHQKDRKRLYLQATPEATTAVPDEFQKNGKLTRPRDEILRAMHRIYVEAQIAIAERGRSPTALPYERGKPMPPPEAVVLYPDLAARATSPGAPGKPEVRGLKPAAAVEAPPSKPPQKPPAPPEAAATARKATAGTGTTAAAGDKPQATSGKKAKGQKAAKETGPTGGPECDYDCETCTAKDCNARDGEGMPE